MSKNPHDQFVWTLYFRSLINKTRVMQLFRFLVSLSMHQKVSGEGDARYRHMLEQALEHHLKLYSYLSNSLK